MIRSFLKGGIFYKTPQLHENASISKDSDIVNKWYVDTKVNNTQINTKQYVDSQINSLNTTVNVVVKNSSIPKGAIIMWSGSIATIPSGWALCNGANGTPDLRDRFVVGAGSSYGVGATGGSKDAVVVSHTHTGVASSDGAHSHTANQITDGPLFMGTYISNKTHANRETSRSGAHTHSLTINSAGQSGTNANLPPYYALAFIMKT
jgi:microcystin-dependent protein